MRLISGECQFETLEQSLDVASQCARIASKYGFEYIYKASFDKANRSSNNGERGQGFFATMQAFEQMKKEIPGLKILTDFHNVQQMEDANVLFPGLIDVCQIPAFLCRQTDLLKKASEYDWVINIKKGQFLAPWDMKGILSKLPAGKEVWVTERGITHGYNTLVVDYTGVRYMLDELETPIVMDATHAVQKPGGNGGSSGGNRDYAPYVAYAAASVGVKDFFFEVHPDPVNAPSDGPNMIYLDKFEAVVEKLSKICLL